MDHAGNGNYRILSQSASGKLFLYLKHFLLDCPQAIKITDQAVIFYILSDFTFPFVFPIDNLKCWIRWTSTEDPSGCCSFWNLWSFHGLKLFAYTFPVKARSLWKAKISNSAKGGKDGSYWLIPPDLALKGTFELTCPKPRRQSWTSCRNMTASSMHKTCWVLGRFHKRKGCEAKNRFQDLYFLSWIRVKKNLPFMFLLLNSRIENSVARQEES